MKIPMNALALLAGLLLAATAGAQIPKPVDQPAPPAAAATMIRARGTIVGFDSAARVLTLKTRNATERFTISPTTRIRENGQDIGLADLQKLAGRRARVRHPDSSDVATSVDIWLPDERNR
jgi:hypothetical protein